MSVFLVSDFNIEVFGRYVEQAAGVTVDHAPFAQVVQALVGAEASADRVGVVWVRPEGVIDGYRRAAEFEAVNHDDVLAEVDAFCERLLVYATKVRALFVCAFVGDEHRRGYGFLDGKPGLGLATLVRKMNLRLTERLEKAPNAYVLEASRWMIGGRAGSPKMWFASKVPYANRVFQEAAKDVAAALRGLEGKARKLVVVDLDDTLWGGVVGEVGPQGVTLGGHDHVGEAFVAFQRALKALTNRGVQVAVVSKNDEAVALEAIDGHPEMVLRRGDLAGWRINWNDKAANVVELVKELRLGLSSVVFLDDSAIERGRVREALPEVLVPEWPADVAEYAGALLSLDCFDTAEVTDEDRTRAKMYATERERQASLASVGSIDEWLASLDVRVRVERLSTANLARATQLFNKTNQLNLSTRRMTEAELGAWNDTPGNALLTFSVSDRFGSSGLTGIVGVRVEGASATLTDFLLSCRVMGRRVEEAMLHVAIAHARAAGADAVRARFVPTARNAPTLELFQRAGLRAVEEHLFAWTEGDYPKPATVTVEGA